MPKLRFYEHEAQVGHLCGEGIRATMSKKKKTRETERKHKRAWVVKLAVESKFPVETLSN